MKTRETIGNPIRILTFYSPLFRRFFTTRRQKMWSIAYMIKDPSRRSFLRTAPAAVAGITLAEAVLNSAAAAQATRHEPFLLISAQTLASLVHTLNASPADKPLVKSLPALPLSVTITCEENKVAKEFEWHEGRDHIFQILEGTTQIELGGTPKDSRNVKAAEWLAPTSAGATAITLNQGDMLVVPRNTPHKRSTVGKVTLILISTEVPHA